jgi:tyrosine-protein phosphatase YwqE
MIDVLEEIKSTFYCVDGILYKYNATYPKRKIGTVGKNGYLAVDFGGIRLYAHTIIFALYNGYISKIIDHKDRNRLNNKIENLRDANHTINAINKGLSSKNKSGIKGVCKGNNKWVAQIKVNKRKIHLGTFNTFKEAVAKRKEAEKQYIYDI